MLSTVDVDQKKILVFGNNDSGTDLAVSQLAQQQGTQNHGLITDATFVPDLPGLYHTTVVDIAWGGLIQLAQRFDQVIMLDQPQDQWTHWKCMQATCKLMLNLEHLGMDTVFRNNANVQHILYWMDLVYKKNSSVCIYPWINLYYDGADLKLCARAQDTVTTIDQFTTWATDPGYQRIRHAMLDGKRMPNHCRTCYQYEEKGVESYRQFETIDWITQLQIQNLDELKNITRPFFYEINTGNHCNIKCRGCQPAFSRPIGEELRRFNIVPPGKFLWEPGAYNIDSIDIDTLDHRCSVYFQGGEPTIMPEVQEFMQRCIDKKRTDFFLTMCTNGVKFSQRFLDLLSHFSNTNFSFSLDGYGPVNDYWRSGSNWSRVIENAHMIQSLGHSVSINTVPGIYNVTNLHLLLEFLDREFPMTAIYMQVNYLPWQSAFNHPMPDLVIDSMKRCQQTSVYHSNGKSCRSSIDSILQHYSNNPQCDLKALRDFFDYNDQLDRVRGTKLADFIPELEQARKFIQ